MIKQKERGYVKVQDPLFDEPSRISIINLLRLNSFDILWYPGHEWII